MRGMTIEGIPEALELLRSLDGKALKQTNKKAMRRCGNILLRKTRQLARQGIRQPGIYERRYPGERPLRRVGVVNVNGEGTVLTVRMTRADWLARILEVGSYKSGVRRTQGRETSSSRTTNRRYRRPVNRGVLPAKGFFEQAQQAVNNDMERTLEQEIERELQRRWRKGKM